MKIRAKDIQLVHTCTACPEQYDAYDNRGIIIGYLRLRWRTFTVKCLSGEIIYSARTDGSGMFETYERDKYLECAKEALANYYNAQKQEEME